MLKLTFVVAVIGALASWVVYAATGYNAAYCFLKFWSDIAFAFGIILLVIGVFVHAWLPIAIFVLFGAATLPELIRMGAICR